MYKIKCKHIVIDAHLDSQARLEIDITPSKRDEFGCLENAIHSCIEWIGKEEFVVQWNNTIDLGDGEYRLVKVEQ